VAYFGRYIQVTLERETFDVKDLSPLYNQKASEYGDVVVQPELVERKYRTEQLQFSSDLKCMFNFTIGSKALSGTVKVYNLSQASRDFAFGGPSGMRGASIILDAGYASDGHHGKILRCSIADISEYKDGSDLVTEYTLGRPSTRYKLADGSVSYDTPKNLYEIIIDGLERNNIEYVDELKEAIDLGKAEHSLTKRDDFAFSGKLRKLVGDYIGEIGRMERDIPQLWNEIKDTDGNVIADAVWLPGEKEYRAKSSEDQFGKVRLYWEDAPKPLKDIIVISPETGIIGVPTNRSRKKSKTIRLKHVLIPQLVQHALVRVRTSGKYTRLANGDYRIVGVDYRGSNYGGKHHVTMELATANIK